MAMDLSNPRRFQAPSVFVSHGESPIEGHMSFYGKSKENPFAEAFHGPLCKLNLKETSKFVKSFPMSNGNTESRGFVNDTAERRREGVNSVTQWKVEAPSTPGRPVFSFSSVATLARKNFPSKWDDAEKWLISNGSCHDSPSHNIKLSEPSKSTKLCDNLKQQIEGLAEKSRVTQERVSKAVTSFQGPQPLNSHKYNSGTFNGISGSTDIVLKDKFTDNVEQILPDIRYLEPTKEGFPFRNPVVETMKDACTEVVHEVHHRDVGTEMTPLGSSTTSRCHTPFKSSSPARHNTPASRSGPLAPGSSDSIDMAQLQDCHLAKLHLGTQFDSVTSNWSSKEEEEEEISKSLRHYETGNACQKTASDSRTAALEEEEKTRCYLRYQREEAKIQAWLNLQNAKAEAQSKKLEVKIQKMRSDLEEKLMKRMSIVHSKTEEWRASARQQHLDSIQKVTEQARKMLKTRHNPHFSSHSSCGCFPCNNNHV
ncbi:Remorin family protein [Quillaja saponaria]|uniref:Remorin family protein n=1 Tax=Quillaja saponaria TaxID=32244 RepID=A0AAD7PE02_QUISA|nr:Remorin family protein [Quillaja saponaria]